nr:MAG TPA: hypothetical protein [Caudoviricetes sp.]
MFGFGHNGPIDQNGNRVIVGSRVSVSTGVNYEDTQVPTTTQRTGTVAPTLTTGFRGNASFQQLLFVNTQADEVQFTVQMPHAWRTGSTVYPHVHFCPAVNIADGSYAVKFILEYYWANINVQYGADAGSFAMTKTFTVASNDHIWKHMLATNSAGLTVSAGISSIIVCRLYRDNTVGSNYGQSVAMLGFDIHFDKDSIGSDEESSKSF